MRPPGPTHWLLRGDPGWRTGSTQRVAVSDRSGMRLTTLAGGPLALDGADGSLGGLVLPRGMAFDASGLLYLLNAEASAVQRFDPASRAFEVLPAVGGAGTLARQFSAEARSIAIAGDNLYVADAGNRRVQVFSVTTLALRYVWAPLGDDDDRAGTTDEQPTEDWDVAAVGGLVVVLDARRGALYAHRFERDRLERLAVEPATAGAAFAGRWSRVIVDRDERVYLLEAAEPRLGIFHLSDDTLHEIGSAIDAGELRDRFLPPPIRLDHLDRFCLPASLSVDCPRSFPEVAPPAEDPLAASRSGGLTFDRFGAALSAPLGTELSGPELYAVNGTWLSQALDSEIYDCRWHKLELEPELLPPGATVKVSAYTDNAERPIEDIAELPEHLWHTSYVWAGNHAVAGPHTAALDVLVDGSPGQFLWVRLELGGDGYATPAVHAVRAQYPRQSYVEHLPAVYAADDEARGFLERFLSLFQAEWDGIEQSVDRFARRLDPRTVPDGWVDYLASWFALPLEGSWSEAQKRSLLGAAVRYYPERGTPRAFRQHLQGYLEAVAGLSVEEQGELPIIVEGFRKRNYLFLNAPESFVDRRRQVWSPAVVGRLELDVYATTGRARLVSPGNVDDDVFDAHAHRFEVFVPAAWVRGAAEERMLRRALDAEKPAHAAYTLNLVEPRLRVGVQSTIGLDTIIGDIPSARLACADGADETESRPPKNRLGYDTVLSSRVVRRGGLPLNPGVRVGVHTLLN
ncbi:MAG TPA: phage tail protein [Polyangiaceae bacterium]